MIDDDFNFMVVLLVFVKQVVKWKCWQDTLLFFFFFPLFFFKEGRAQIFHDVQCQSSRTTTYTQHTPKKLLQARKSRQSFIVVIDKSEGGRRF